MGGKNEPCITVSQDFPQLLAPAPDTDEREGGREEGSGYYIRGVGRKLLAPAPNGKRKGKRDSLYRGGRTVIRTPAHNM